MSTLHNETTEDPAEQQRSCIKDTTRDIAMTAMTNGYHDDVNISTEMPSGDEGLPVFGYPGYVFWLIHWTGIAFLFIGICFSSGVIIYFFINNSGEGKKFWRLHISERLVLYLAITDLCHNATHISDHAYMVIAHDHPPDKACVTIASVLMFWTQVQMMVVLFTAVNVCVLVVRETKMNLGKHDWKFLLYALGCPAVCVSVGLGFGAWGPSGAWCVVDMRKKAGPVLANAIGVAQIATFVTSAVCYTLVWLHVRRVSTAAGSWEVQQKKYAAMARKMAVFVAAYMGQWWAYTVQAAWTFITNPPLAVIVLTVIFSNIGGIFNCLAYTVLRRRRNRGEAHQKPENRPGISGNTSTSSINLSITCKIGKNEENARTPNPEDIKRSEVQ